MKVVLKITFLLQLVFVASQAISQEVSCEDLEDFIRTNGYRKGQVSSFTLQSSWLYEVTAYSYDYKVYVIAKIKKNEYSFTTSSYIFCGVPDNNWTRFQWGGYGESDSYGERFHELIFPYQCNCY